MASAMQAKLRTSAFVGVSCRPQAVKTNVQVAGFVRPERRRVVTQASYIGSPTNLIIVASTTAFLVAGRFGLAPTANKTTTAGLKLVPQDPGLKTGDPSGFSAVDVLGLGALGHVVGVGTVLGLKVMALFTASRLAA